MSFGPSPDPQDPLPEANWLWRRVFCFLVVGALLFFVWGSVDRLGRVAILAPANGIPALVSVTKSILALTMLTVTYYLLAPSAEQMVKLMKTASLLKSGVQMASRSKSDRQGTETATTVGLPPAPPVPPSTDDRYTETPDAENSPMEAPDADSGLSGTDQNPPEGSEVTSTEKTT